MAADPGAVLCAGLSRRPRGGASRRNESFTAVLEGGRQGLRSRRARQDLARYLRQRPASLRHSGLVKSPKRSILGKRLSYKTLARRRRGGGWLKSEHTVTGSLVVLYWACRRHFVRISR